MKKLALTLAGTLIFLMVACSQKPASTESTAPNEESQSAAAPAGTAESFTGEIMDSACAAMGSHEQMLKSEGAKNAKDCTLKCVKMGSKFVLYNPATKTTYQLDDQTKPEQFAGEKVDVTGTLDSATGTIHVESIAAA